MGSRDFPGTLLRVLGVLVVTVSGSFAQAEPGQEPPLAMPVGPLASIPAGWVDFCARYRGECDGGPWPEVEIDLDPRTRARIERINKRVNATVTPVPDAEQWGVADRWDYPEDGKGDCEDFALLKRRLLVAEAFPKQAVLLTIVKDGHNDGHAVLTVRTKSGDFILDNLNDEMKPWDRTGYRFVKRQSQTDPRLWVQLGEPTPSPEFVSR